ncbi:MAG: cyclopropane-fatty-acyl-phospholipid synthase family protein [Actinomycetota bacterium]|nr:cyclopropane-fatty-acyl-phospholipid synthase family protein [Actinomycetota bacterium]
MKTSVAQAIAPFIDQLLGGDLPIDIQCWDGSRIGPPSTDAHIVLNSPNALRRLLYSPNELGFGRAYVSGELDIRGDIFSALELRERLVGVQRELRLDRATRAALIRAARSTGALGLPLRRPSEEARLSGRLHSLRRDRAAIAHHYDVSNAFYRLVLGSTMTYSCAVFAEPTATLEEAQTAKHDLVARKLGLESGMRVLDVGCGWGGFLVHAASTYGVSGVGITLSEAQADVAEKRIAEAGLADKVEIRVQDYRDVRDGPFDAISSIGMFEHVGLARLNDYFANLHGLLSSQGRLLNHAISRPPGPPGFNKRSFVSRYVFPDGELHEVGSVVSAMQTHGFEVRDVESLREHYALTLRAWVTNLEDNFEEAVALVGQPRARIWRLYMAGAAVNFEDGGINVHQVLGVKPGPRGASGMPPTRRELLPAEGGLGQIS